MKRRWQVLFGSTMVVGIILASTQLSGAAPAAKPTVPGPTVHMWSYIGRKPLPEPPAGKPLSATFLKMLADQKLAQQQQRTSARAALKSEVLGGPRRQVMPAQKR